MPLPLKKLLTESDVDANVELFEAVQGYSLVPHGRDHVWLALLRFTPQDPTDAGRVDVLKVLCSYGEKATSALTLYKSYKEYQEYRAKVRAPRVKKLADMKKETIYAVGLASPAYSPHSLEKPKSVEFDNGFVEQFKELPEVAPLQRSASTRYAAIIVVGSNDETKLKAEKQDFVKKLKEYELRGLVEVEWEEGKVMKKNKVVTDHFGYREGISQPVFFDVEPHRTSDWKSGWDPAKELESVLT